ncbi:protein-tyrosine-phosphatase [Coemansia guatemalensis]|uniref:Protein-tyrosine-phosphatase n=1 Tax=Coemansia guatemalensis TaxID=2761395 RepID=A0A9W8HYG3_9FUNG|nr:protein-tyrosine-phosphatase [Coemansia guatemalensis]
MADIIDPLIPPYRFERVQNRLYRGGYPKPRNFRFLRRQRLKTIVSLIPGDRDSALSEFCQREGIERISITVDSPDDNVTLNEQIVSQCLELMTDPTKTPLYIHCLDGSNVTGVVVMCLRKLQLWRVASLQNEYLRFEQDGEIIPEESEFVEVYAGNGLLLPNPYVDWLWPGRCTVDDEPLANNMPFPGGVHPVVPKAKIRPRPSSDICLPSPSAGLSRSATDPSLLESPAVKSRASVDSLRSKAGIRNSTTGADIWPGGAKTPVQKGRAQGQESHDALSNNGQTRVASQLQSQRREDRAALEIPASLHTSTSAGVLAEPTVRSERSISNGNKSRRQSGFHDVLEPALAALASDSGMPVSGSHRISRHAHTPSVHTLGSDTSVYHTPAPCSRNSHYDTSSNWDPLLSGTVGHDGSTEQSIKTKTEVEEESQTEDVSTVFQTNHTVVADNGSPISLLTSRSAIGAKVGEAKDIVLSNLVLALAIEGLGM